MDLDNPFKAFETKINIEPENAISSPKQRKSPRHSPKSKSSPKHFLSPKPKKPSPPKKRKFTELDSDSVIPSTDIEASIDHAALAEAEEKRERETKDNETETDKSESVQIIDPPRKKRRLSDLPTLSALSQLSDFSDITFKVGDKTFFGNKAIFAVKSGVFGSLLYPQNGQSVNTIELSDISASAFSFIRDFVYDQQPKISFDNVVSVLNAAKLYQIPLIEEACSQYLNEIDSVGHLLAVLEQFGGLYSLENELNYVLESNMDLLNKFGSDIIKSDKFKKLPWFMAKRFIQSDALGVSEEDLFKHTDHWLETNGDELKQMLRFCRMPIDFIFDHVKARGILNDGDLVSIYEMKLGLTDRCIFNCNERYQPKKNNKRRRGSPRGQKKLEVNVDEDEDIDVAPQPPTPKKKGRKKKASPKKKTTPKKTETKKRGRGRPKGSGKKK